MSDGNASAAETEVNTEEIWNEAVEEIKNIDPSTENWKTQSLPLARIKKIMKCEEFILHELEKERLQQVNPGKDVAVDKQKIKFMISQEAPMLMTKACELLIKDMTARAWQHTDRNRRRTLQKPDLFAAVGESEVFDFLIDIVPRVHTVPVNRPQATEAPQPMVGMPPMAAVMAADPVMMNLTGGDMTMQQQLQQQQQQPDPIIQQQQANQQFGMFFAQMQAPIDGTEQQQQFQQPQQQQQQQQQGQQQWAD